MVLKNNEFQIFIKPAGANCNLSCNYCYYLNRKNLYPSSSVKIMEDDILEEYISQHILSSPYPEIFFSWHGGEPTLAGIDFFRRAADLQKKHKPEGYTIVNGIQTNGTLLDDSWGRFFNEEDFFVGISIDGTREMHDKFRVYRDGSPSFDKAIKGYNILREYNINTEILCVVSSANVNYPLEVYRFLKSLGSRYVTFLPLVESVPGGDRKVSDISVSAHDFGKFLCVIFDEWIDSDIGNIKIQIIEEALRTAFNQDHTLCIFKKVCGGVPVIEHNGDFFSCDHYVDRDHFIGNIRNAPLARLLDDERQLGFGRAKKDTLPGYCLECEVLGMCNGECPKNRFINTPSGDHGLNYLCSGYRMFFNHIRPFAEAVRSEWDQSSR